MTTNMGGKIEKGRGGKLGHGLHNQAGDISVNPASSGTATGKDKGTYGKKSTKKPRRTK